MSDVDVDSGVHPLQASIPLGLNEDDNATLLQSIFLNDYQQRMELTRQALAQHMGVQYAPTGAGITVSHVHNHLPAPIVRQQEPAPTPVQQPGMGVAGKAGIATALALASALAGAGALSYFRPVMPTPVNSTTTTTNNVPPCPVVIPSQDDKNYKIGIE